MADPRISKVRDFVMKNALQLLISTLLMVIIGIFTYHFHRVESLEERVWNLEQRRAVVDSFECQMKERTTGIQRQIDKLCADFEKDVTRLEGKIDKLLHPNGLSASAVQEPAIQQGG